MNAPAPLIQRIALEQLFPSPTNPRKRFNQAKLEELAASIKTQDVLQPILVRPIGDQFEIIAGERRYRASKIAEKLDMPCFIRELTDVQVLHAQVIENLQRDDLHPIEEAEGYELLMQKQDEDGNKFTADSIAAEVGKSRAYVYGRLKLLDLCQEARDAFFDGGIDSSTALLIARIPTQKLQIEALEVITDDDMSFRTARDHVQRFFMLDLSKAPFDIKCTDLLDKAGACVDCIKRTGNQPELFDDVSSKDVCTDTECFSAKKTSNVALTIKQAEESGDEVIRKDEARKMIPYNGDWYIRNSLRGFNLALLDEEIPGDADERTWKDALETHGLLSGKKALHKTIIENPHEDGIFVAIDSKVAMEALTKAGFQIKEEEEEKQTPDQSKAAEAKQKAQEIENARIEAEIAKQNAFRKRLFEAVRQKVADDFSSGIVAEGLYVALTANALTNCNINREEVAELLQHYVPVKALDDFEQNNWQQALQTTLKQLTPQQHLLVMIDCLSAGDIVADRYNYDDTPDDLYEVANTLGINTLEVEQEVNNELSSAQKPKKPAKKGAK